MKFEDIPTTPSAEEMMASITKVCSFGVRRPGYSAEARTVEFIASTLSGLGMDQVRVEEFPIVMWTPGKATVRVPSTGLVIDGFPLPLSAPTGSVSGRNGPLQGPLTDFDDPEPSGKIAFRQVDLPEVEESEIAPIAKRVIDPDGYFDKASKVLPFTLESHTVLDLAAERGALGVIGLLRENYWESCDYYLPYDAKFRPTPGLWLSPAGGQALMEELHRFEGVLDIEMQTESDCTETTANTVYAVLEGTGDGWVIVGTHHDAPWASAVEDGSGIAMVLEAAKVWSKVPRKDREHNLLFLFHGAHMYGGEGTKAFMREHESLLSNTVLAIHLEHAARQCSIQDGRLTAKDEPETRWWFVSDSSQLEDLTAQSIAAESLGRSMIFAPDVFMEHPPTDGGMFHLQGVPLVNFLSAPPYLFDSADTISMVHEPSLVPLVNVASRLICGVSAEARTSFREVS